MEEKQKKKSGSGIGGIFLAGCMFIGAGIGYLYKAIPAGASIGMGVGLLAMAAIMAYYRGR